MSGQERVVFVTGRAGAGKTAFLRERMRALLQKGERVLVLVPEQFTFETERELTEELTGGLWNADVFSFTTLAREVLKKSGERSVFLSKQGMRMVVRKSAEECASSLTAFQGVSNSPGFGERCGELFALCKRFEVTHEALREASEKLSEDALLKHKLTDLALLYAHTQGYLQGRYIDEEDAFHALLRLLPASFITGCHVFIDGFDLLTEQIYRVIGLIMEHAKSVHISFRADFSRACRDEALFASEKKAYARLSTIASGLGLSPLIERLEGEGARVVKPALKHLEREGFAYPFKVFEGEAEGIRLFLGSDRAAEAFYVADHIQSAAKNGVRYRDMAVVATDMETYMPIVSRVFRNRSIPFFTDAKHPLSSYPAARLLNFALRAVTRGFLQADMLELIKTGLCGVAPSGVELFENYVIGYGIRGSAFLKPFEKGEVPLEAEEARKALAEPLLMLREALAGGKTAAEKTKAVYAYIEALSVRAFQSALCEKLKEENRFELALENAQVFNHIMELLSQLHAIMGDTRMSNARFAAVLSEGFDAIGVSAIPATADQVLFGSVGRTRARSVRALFVLGANEGAFPMSVSDDGMIDDRELNKLQELGVTAWYNSLDKTSIALQDVYSAVTKPTELLVLSCRMADGGTPETPSALFDRVKALFPNLLEETDVNAPFKPVDAQSAFTSLLGMLRRYADTNEKPARLQELYACFLNDKGFKERLENAERALFFSGAEAPFGEALATLLYGSNGTGSATRLESFNACPFQHFARYGLRLKPRKEYRIDALEEGSFLHEALSSCIDALKRRYDDFSLVTEELCDAVADEVLPPIIARHKHGVFLDNARSVYRCAELTRTVKATLWAAVRQIALGRFYVEGTELSFGGKYAAFPAIVVELENGARFELTGKIDRLDGYVRGSEQFYRVVDYKSSQTDFDFADLYNGLKLQLPLYARAVLAAKSAARAAGLYYARMQDPVLASGATEEEALEKKLFEKFRLSGLTLNDPDIVRATAGEDKALKVISTRADSKGLVEENVLRAVMDYANKKTKETLSLILEGHMTPAPYRKQHKNDQTPCAYCDYKSVCAFDPKLSGCAYRRVDRLDRESFMKRSGKEERTHGVDA